MRVAGSIRIPFGSAARFYAIEEIANVERRRVTADFFDRSSGDKLRRAEHEFAAIAGFDPTGLAFESHRARAQWQPTVLAEDQLHTIGIAGDDLAVFRRVKFDGSRTVRPACPLAKVDAVRTPFE